jgi:hypothetical protein
MRRRLHPAAGLALQLALHARCSSKLRACPARAAARPARARPARRPPWAWAPAGRPPGRPGHVGLMADTAHHRPAHAATARTTRSSLKAHRSSSEPPPRTSSTVSTRRRPGRCSAASQRGRRLGALHQAGHQHHLTCGARRCKAVITSCSAAAPGDVTTPRARVRRQRPLARASNRPCCRGGHAGAGTPRTASRRPGAAWLDHQLQFAARSYTRCGRAVRPAAVAGAKSSSDAARRNIAQRSSACCAVGVLQRK